MLKQSVEIDIPVGWEVEKVVTPTLLPDRPNMPPNLVVNLKLKRIQWEPKMGQKFYYMDSLFYIQETTYDGSSSDKVLIEEGNCWKSREKAKLFAEDIKEHIMHTYRG